MAASTSASGPSLPREHYVQVTIIGLHVDLVM